MDNKPRTYLMLLFLLGASACVYWVVRDKKIDQTLHQEGENTEPAANSRNAGREAASFGGPDQNTNSTLPSASRDVGDDSVEMRNLSGAPTTAGRKGLWAGQGSSDAATSGELCYAVARSGDSRADLKPDQNGLFQRLFAPADTEIQFDVIYPNSKGGSVVHLGLLDGGEISHDSPVETDSSGKISFVFKSGPSDGSYRIMLTTSEHDTKMIDVWVGRPEWEQPITTSNE